MAYTYYVPSVQIAQEFTSIPTFTSSPLSALIIGWCNPLTTDVDVNGVTLVTGVATGNPLVTNVNTLSTLNSLITSTSTINSIGVISSIGDINTIIGTPSVNNPVALGVYNALLNSNGAPVYFVPLTTEGNYTNSAATDATGSFTCSASTNFSDGDTVSISNVTYRFKTVPNQVNDIKIATGTGGESSLVNLNYAILGTGTNTTTWDAGSTQAYYTGTTTGAQASPAFTSSVLTNVLTVTASQAGVAGNLIPTSAVAVTASWGATTLTGAVSGAAAGTVVSTATNVSDGDTVLVAGVVYTFKTTLSATYTEGQVLIGSSAANSLINLQAAINHTGTANVGTKTVTAGAQYSVAVPHPIVYAGTITSLTLPIISRTTGTTNNGLVITATTATAAWTTTNLSGGAADVPTITAWTNALTQAQKNNTYYGLVPVWSPLVPFVIRSTVSAAVVGHVEALSTPQKAKWRAAWFSTPVNGNILVNNPDVSLYIGTLPIAYGINGPSSPNNARFHNVFPGTYSIGTQAYDGCFAAAALAGLRSGSVPHQSLTNSQLNLGGNALLPDVVNNYSVTILNNLAQAGVWIITQDVLGGTVYTRHQLTAEGASSGSNQFYMQDSITANVDSISYSLQAALQPYVGIYNISPAALLKIRAAIDNTLNFLATNTYTERAGNQLISYTIVSIAQDATFQDMVDVTIQLQVPFPMDYINVTLSI